MRLIRLTRLKNLKNRKIVSLLVLILFIFNFLIFFLLLTPAFATAQDTSQPEASLTAVPDSEYKTSKPGETTSYKLILRNQGAQRETFIINIESEYSWDVEVTPQTGVSLSPDETEDIIITFQIPASLREIDYQFKVIVKSRNIPAAETIVHIIPNQNEVVITAALRPVLIITPSKENLGKISPGDTVEVDINVKCYVVSAEVYIEYDLFKEFKSKSKLAPERNLSISIDPESAQINKGESFTFTVKVKFPKSFDKKINYGSQLRLFVKAYGQDEISKPVTLSFILEHQPEEDFFTTLVGSPIVLAGITTLVTIGILGAAIGSTEVGKYRFLAIFFIPLYTKLHKDKILDHFTRGRVYEYIRNNPGVHYSQIKRELDLNNGNLTYHLKTLEREALIKSRSAGRFKIFYVTGVQIPQDMEPQISVVRKQVLDMIRAEPGISQKELADRFDDKSQRTISYHVKNMAREGVLRLEKDGRENKCYINEEKVDLSENVTDSDKNSKKQDDIQKDDMSNGVIRQI